ncbi:hypothetical protein HYQ45_015833 [Verticillium longisporum]|uniref:Uncharacterized protein n=1 Tax=Verticillium longisporum TaxID=100787 RepID=A0A8I2Z7U9_VERLO|nr:hypothetical protein HYQ45_015833 [Verticillium longisporum]
MGPRQVLSAGVGDDRSSLQGRCHVPAQPQGLRRLSTASSEAAVLPSASSKHSSSKGEFTWALRDSIAIASKS